MPSIREWFRSLRRRLICKHERNETTEVETVEMVKVEETIEP